MATDCILYRFYNQAGDLLYIGMSTNMLMRLKSHRHDQPWWGEAVEIKMERFATRDELAAAEITAIELERPRHNVAHLRARGPLSRPRRKSGEGGIFQRLDGLWVGTCEAGYDSRGKRIQRRVYGKNRKVVEQKLAALKAAG